MRSKAAVLRENLFFLIMGTAYTFAISNSVITSTVLGTSNAALLFFSILFVFVLNIYFANKYTAAVFSSILFLTCFFMFTYLFLDDFKAEWYTHTKAFIYDIYMFIRGVYPYSPDYDKPIAAVLCLAIATISIINLKMRFNFFILACFGGVILLLPVFFDYYRTGTATLIFSFCFLVFLLKKLNKNAGFVLIPLCAGLIFLTGLLPAPYIKNAFGSALARRGVIGGANDFLYETFNPKYFSFQATGFTGKNGRLGGRVTARGNFVMDVYAQERVYLSGAVKNLYTGYSWEGVSEETPVKTYTSTTFELTNAFADAYNIDTADIAEEFLSQAIINIGSARTATVFKPLHAINLDFSSPVMLYQNTAGDLSADALLLNNSEYTIKYVKPDDLIKAVLYQVRRNRGQTQAYIRAFSSSSAQLYDDGQVEIIDVKIKSILSPGQLYAGIDFEIDPQSLYLPDNLPERVYDLTNEITKGAASSYEKINAIVSYLSEYAYTLEPDDVPYNEDFVDYFLFTGKEGYCTYFASALAVMGRIAGVPTRYIEGYVTPPNKTSYGAYQITTYQAHAWVEAYIDGIWRTFEPTPPFAYTSRAVTPPTEVFSNSMAAAGGNYEGYMEEMGFSEAAPAPVAAPAAAATARDLATERFFASVKLFAAVLFSFVLAVLFLLLIFAGLILARRRKFARIDSLDNRDTAKAYFTQILKAAKVYDYAIDPNETVRVYAARIGKRFAFLNETVFMAELADIFAGASYGEGSVSDDDAQKMKTCYLELLSMLKRYKLPKIQFYFYKYVINII